MSDRPAAGPGRLVLVATPIGNLGDLSPRAVAALEAADVVCCEDTRRTRALLAAAAVPARGRLVAVHEHNESARTAQVLDWVRAGRDVAVVTDAGMPAISDPGARLVAAVAAEGLPVTVVPGPSAVLAALVVSGLPTERFCVEGFLPRKGPERRRRLAALATEERTALVLEAPGRVAATLIELAGALGAARPAAVARELTKVHEEVVRGTAAELATRYAESPPRGEVVLVIGPAPAPTGADLAPALAAVRRLIDAGAKPRVAAGVVGELTGTGANALYQALTAPD